MIRHKITAMSEDVLSTLLGARKGDTEIWMDTLLLGSSPSSTRGTRRILHSLVAIGYAACERVNGRDYWKITEAGERHWPTDEEIEANLATLRALCAKSRDFLKKSKLLSEKVAA